MNVYTININTIKVLAIKPICTGWLIGLHDPMKDTAEALEGLELAGIEEVNTAGIKVEAGSLSRFEAVDV